MLSHITLTVKKNRAPQRDYLERRDRVEVSYKHDRISSIELLAVRNRMTFSVALRYTCKEQVCIRPLNSSRTFPCMHTSYLLRRFLHA